MDKPMHLIKRISFILGCFLFTQCFETSYQRTDNRLTILRAISSEIVLNNYEELTTLSQTLGSTISNLCTDPSESTLLAARDAWWATRKPWKKSEVINFGPIAEYPLRLGPKLDSWPVNEEAVEDLINDTDRLTQEIFSALGGATRGLSVVEYLLWHGEEDRSALDRLTADPYRCIILSYASTDVIFNTNLLEETWRNEWLTLVNSVEPSESKFLDEEAVISEWVNRMAFTIENIRINKFEKPLGNLSPEDVRPDIIESRYSHRSIDDARDALLGVIEIWHGTEDEIKNGLKYLVKSRQVIDRLNDKFVTAQTTLDSLEGELTSITTRQPNELNQALDSLKDLQRSIQVDLTQAIQVTIRFNDTDGD
jgi:putative iron-regulated protein